MRAKKLVGLITLWALLLSLSALIAGCAAEPTAPTTPANTISGKVTNSLASTPVAGAEVTVDPVVKDVKITTGGDGTYSASLPPGTFTVTFKKDNFKPATKTVLIIAGQMATLDAALEPEKPVVVSAGTAQAGEPGASVTLKASVQALDGSSITGYQWTQTAGVKATIDNATSDTINVKLASAAAYKTKLIDSLKFLDRFMVQGINPHSLEAAEMATFQVTVTTSKGSYKASVNVTAHLPYAISLGIENVPKGVPVLLHGKNQSAYNWSMSGPSGSTARLDSSTDQNPSFTPDASGKYTLTESNSGATVNVYAGTWAGVITGENDKGRPLAAGCTTCHNGTAAPDKFTPWMESGHAEIFTQNINDPAGHWSINCASCHTVGYDPDVENGGFDEAMATEGWKVPPHGEVGYWSTMLKDYPKTAQLANIQCDSCHGPTNSELHMNGTIDAARVSLTSELCGSCHGEPLRHGRFQQWEESKHAGTSTTPARGVNNSHCGRCHSAQGFLAWIQQDDLSQRIQGASGNATNAEMAALGMTADKILPITCVTCHDPHAQGTVSGEPTEATRPSSATVRVMDVTKLLPAGFKAENVGKGALCITCHNTRNGPHNDEFPTNLPTSYSAPHTAAQGDLLLGESAYLVDTPHRSPHASVKDSCVTCHMEATPPPAEFSYQGGGTNHTFEASLSICGSCHTPLLDGHAFQTGTEDKLHEVAELMGEYLLGKIGAQVTIKDYTPHEFNGKSYDVKSNAIAIDKTNIASAEPTEPHGQISFIFKFKTPVTFTYAPSGEAAHTVSLSEAEVQLADISGDGKTALIPVTDILVKVGWNFFLIEGDGSMGIHNPEFTDKVLHASIEALK